MYLQTKKIYKTRIKNRPLTLLLNINIVKLKLDNSNNAFYLCKKLNGYLRF